MKLSIHPYFLRFHRPFVLAHGIREGTQLAFVKIEHEGITAYGEASLPPYLHETVESVSQWVKKQNEIVSDILGDNPFERQNDIPFSETDNAASAALQSAILNWYVKSTGTRMSDHFKASESHPWLSLTTSKSDLDFLDDKIKSASDFTHLKLKLTGADDDLEFVNTILKHGDMPFCVDINQGCKNKEEAIVLIEALEKLECYLVEQPLKSIDHDGHYWLKQRVETPIIADESIRTYTDLEQYHEAYSGINVKVMKSGGLIQAHQMLQFSPSNSGDTDFIKVLGCMSESTLSVSNSSVLASQCDIADLDAPYLTKNDPFTGFHIRQGRIELDEPIKLRNGISLK